MWNPKRLPEFSLAGVMTGVLFVLFVAFAVLARLGWISIGGRTINLL